MTGRHVAYWHKADITGASSHVRMSAIGGKADMAIDGRHVALMTQSGHRPDSGRLT